jgi:hypothetical protein
MASIPDGTAVGGNKRGNNAVDLQTSRIEPTKVASGNQSVVGGGNNNIASGTQSTISGGNENTASAQWAVICGASGAVVSQQGGFVGAGVGQTCSGGYAVVVGGANNTASGGASFIGAGEQNLANGAYSTVPGGYQASTRSLHARLSYSSGRFSIAGDAQWGLHVLRRQTTDATASVLTADAGAPGVTTIPVLPDSSLYSFRIRVSCIQSAGTAGTVGDCKAWDVIGAIKRGANAAATVLLGTPTIVVLGADTGLGADNVTGAIISITADTTRGGINVNVTGQVDKTLRWVASVETTEVDY